MNWQGCRVVVTGGAGFLGSHLCEALVARGARVTVVDDFSYGSPHNLDAIAKDIELVQHRLGDDVVDGRIGGDVLFHLAALADPRKCKEDFDLAFRTNVIGTKSVLAGWHNFERIICISSAAVYGEPDYVPIDESHPLKGRDPYAITKILGEWLCKHYFENAGAPVTIARNFNTFGPRQTRAYLIPTLICQALLDKKIEIWNAAPVRDFNYVGNTSDALLAIAASRRTVGQTINVGMGQGISAGEVAERIASRFRVPVINLEKAVTGSAKLVCDNTRLKDTTGWAPVVSFEEGLRETIEYFQHLGEAGKL